MYALIEMACEWFSYQTPGDMHTVIRLLGPELARKREEVGRRGGGEELGEREKERRGGGGSGGRRTAPLSTYVLAKILCFRSLGDF